MLGTRNAIANLATKDLEKSRLFFTRTLGLEEVGREGDELITFASGGSNIYVYRSDYAGTNKATALTWEVDDIAAEVAELRDKGVSFEHYDMEGLERDGDVHVGEGMKIAWFKDPDGNILSLVQDG
jgi:catechol 2,3-dioxygenase-like lactoylglutathione lyase family enzyme